MSRFLRRFAAGALLASVAAVPAGAAAASGSVATSEGGGGAATVRAAAVPGQLTLLNGDRVLVSRAGGGVGATVVGASGGSLAASVMTLRVGQRTFVIPAAALPYLGRGLDLSLFDAGLLQRAERDGRLPVTMHYRGRLHAPPGVTVTRTRPGAAEGYLTSSSAARLGAALARQMVSDHAAGSYGSSGLFAGGLSVGLSGAPAPPARPAFPTHTLTVTGTNQAGKPDTGDMVDLFNINDPDALSGFAQIFANGTAKYSVPSGTYWALGSFLQPVDNGHHVNLRMDVLPQFSVQANKTVHLDARAAASKVVITTPRPAAMQNEGLSVLRSAPGAFPTGVTWLITGSAGDSIFVSPVSRHPSDGTLQSYTFAQLTSPAAAAPYAYALNFVSPSGTIPPQHLTAHPADLATISEREVQDRKTAGSWEIAGGTPAEIKTFGTSAAPLPTNMPFQRTTYVSARPAMLWQTTYLEYMSVRDGQTLGGQTATPLQLHPGQHLSQDWNEYPLHPAPNVVFPGDTDVVRSSADRAGDTLNLDVTPFSDNTLGHRSFDGLLTDFPSPKSALHGSYAVYQNGVKVAGGDAVKATAGFGDVQVSAKLKPGPSVAKFVFDATRAGAQYRLSATSHDVWTWRTKDRPGVTLPQPWLCDFTAANTRKCAVEPMMTLNYQIAGLGLVGQTHPGRQAVTFTAGHIQLAPNPAITHAAMSVSYDGGKTWHTAQVTKISAQKFRAVFTAPAGATVTMRTSAADAAGGTITETLTSAYQISSS